MTAQVRDDRWQELTERERLVLLGEHDHLNRPAVGGGDRADDLAADVVQAGEACG